MHIIQLISKNIKNLRAVQLTPNGGNVTLSGKNGAGKSAVLDSIMLALKSGVGLEGVIRQGEEEGEVVVQTEKWTARKRLTKKGARLTITNSEGAVFSSPQALLDQVIGELAFDPLAFSRLKPREQRELLVKVVGLETASLDLERAQLFDERTAVNRDLSKARGVFASLAAPDPSVGPEEVTVAAAMRELERLEALGRVHAEWQTKVDSYLTEEAKAQQAIEQLEAQLAVQRDYMKSMYHLRVEVEAKEPDAVSPAQLQIAKAVVVQTDEHNTKVRAAKAYAQAEAELQAAIEQSDALTAQIEALDAEKVARIAAAKFPIDGLGLDDDGVIFQGLPFRQLSTGQQMRVSTAMAMALNPSLKVLFIRDGSLLDSAGVADLHALAREQGFQVFMEKTDESGTVGIYIESGEVKAVDGVAL